MEDSLIGAELETLMTKHYFTTISILVIQCPLGFRGHIQIVAVY